MTSSRSYRIGELAAQAGVSTRTIRYYGELGLLVPSGHSPGGARRFDDDDAERLLRIRELQVVMGFDLDEIKRIVSSEERLRAIRAEYRSGSAAKARQRELLEEAMRINRELRDEVRTKIARTQGFLEDLDAKAVRYRAAMRELASAPARR